MEDYRESTVIVARFWERLLQVAPESNSTSSITYIHGLFVLFLLADMHANFLGPNVVAAVRTGDNPGALFNSENSVVSWLHQARHKNYEQQLNRAFMAAVVDLGYRTEELPKFAEESEWLRVQFERMIEWYDQHGPHLIIDVFDEGHAKIVSHRTDPARESFAAHLSVSCMFDGDGAIADIFGRTAHLAKILGTLGRRNFQYLIDRNDPDPFTAMRMRMQDVYVDRLDFDRTLSNNNALPAHMDFVLLNPPSREGRLKGSAQKALYDDVVAPAFAFSEWLLRQRSRFGLALLIVPRLDCISNSMSYNTRRELIRQRALAAVIDFPVNALDDRRRFSAWLITGTRRVAQFHKDHVLFIDAEPMSRFTSKTNTDVTANFIGALIANIFEALDSQARLLNRLRETEPLLANIFSREFADGQHEAQGLSRSVPVDIIERHDFPLEAKAYLAAEPGDLWRAGMNRRQLDALLTQHDVLGKRMYIIGNNGEGKSILLRDVALETAEKGRRTIVIAFGASDRFSKRPAKKYAPFYRYMGARTTRTGVNTLQTAVDLGALMLGIHSDPDRLRVLDKILDLTGFTSHQFLLPKELKANTGQQNRLISGIVRFASDDPDDLALIEKVRTTPGLARKYKLGLRRSNSRDYILPFDELSSGEQQIIALAAKMISEAERKTLFIIDEPEISLHVAWQRAVPKIFAMIAQEFQVDVLVATHSPVLITSADDRDDYCFTARDRALQELSQDDRRSVETALFEGFRTYTNNNREIHERCASLVAGFIDDANGPGNPEEAIRPVLKKLDDMKEVINLQQRFTEQDGIRFDLGLIERAKAAVREMADLAAQDASRGDE
jgi:ABC-type transport system involved in cytochrome c biogenesis ATPase subunit